MIAHCYTHTAETAVLGSRGLDQTACRADVVRLEQHMIVRVIMKPCLVSGWSDVMCAMSGAEPREKVRLNQEYWDW